MSRFALAARIGLFALILMTLTAQVHAQTVTTNVEATIDGAFSEDPMGPSSSPLTSSLTFPQAFTLDFSDDGQARASQNPDGSGAVYVNTLWANGSAQNTIRARTTWTQSDTNNSAAAKSYDFQFLITPASLWIGDFAGLEDTDPRRPVISFDITIRANGSPIFLASASLFGGSVSHQLIESGASLGPVFAGGGSTFGYDFQSYADIIDLGLVGPGETITLEYEMVATVDTPGFEAGGRAQIGDPFDLESTPGFVGTLRADGVVSNDENSWGRVKSLYR